MTGASLLFYTIIRWAEAQGATNVKALPGCWHGETDEWTVRINGHSHEVEDVPPFSAVVMHKTALLGIAVLNIAGGCITGPTEDELISHFGALIPEGCDGQG